MFRVLGYWLLWILLMGVAVFATQNPTSVTIEFLFFRSIPVPLGLVLICCGGLGGIAATTLPELNFSTIENTDRVDTTYRYQYTPEKSKSKPEPPQPKTQNDWEEPWEDDWG